MIGSYQSKTHHAASTRVMLAILRWAPLLSACESVLVYAFLMRRGSPNVGDVGSAEFNESRYPKKGLRGGVGRKTGRKKELKWYKLEMLTWPCVSNLTIFFGNKLNSHSGGIAV